MGAAISRNVSRQIISTSTEIANTYVQNCTGSGSQVFGIDISSGCTASTGDINISNTQVINVKCVQNTTTRSSMQADIESQIIQQSLAAAQSIGGPSLSFAESISQFAASASSSITNIYTQTCLAEANQSFGITCTDPGSSLQVGAINVSNSQNLYANCTANNSTINDLTTQLANIINQQTSAKEADSLIAFAIVGLIFLGIIGIGFIYTVKGPIGWVIIAVIAVLVVVLIVYAALAFSRKLYPFNQQTNLN